MSTQVHPEFTSSRESAPALCQALERGLGQPINALRASMESLAREFELSDPRSATLDAALTSVARLSRNVGDLIDYAFPPEPRPLECSIEEILYSARFQLPHELWQHLMIARERTSATPRLFIDGPVLAQSIARLVHSTIAQADPRCWLMLRASAHGPRVSFTVMVHNAQDPVGYQADPTGLCHSIAQRDLSVIGCSLTERVINASRTTFVIQLPESAVIPAEQAA